MAKSPPPKSSKPLLSRRAALGAIGVAVLLLGGLVAVGLAVRSSGTGAGTTAAQVPTQPVATTPSSPQAAAVAKTVTSVPRATIERVGKGTAEGLWPIAAGQRVPQKAKPLVLYVGAEYCPYCATERWALVNALGRFGSFKGLQLTSSSAEDVFPSTPSFTFRDATYKSPYLDLQAVETETNVPQGNGYQPLQKLTPAQQQLVQKYDSPPFVPSAAAGAIPFLLVGGRYVHAGAQYHAEVLQGAEADQIAQFMHDPQAPIAKGAVGAANWLTAALCNVTKNRPASACSLPAIRTLQREQS
jgi:hypothetical protein